MSLSTADLATHLVSDLGYWGLSAGLFLDSFGVPVPSEVLIPLAVVGAAQGHLDLWAVAVVAVVAQVAGATVSYVIGRRGGVPAVRRFGRYVLLSPQHLERAERVFARYGGWIAAVGRCLPVVRGLIGFPAGAAHMPLGRFVAWTAVGSVAWTGVLVGLGELLSTNLGLIDRVFNQVSVAFVVALVAAAVLYVRRARRRRPAPVEETPSETEARAAAAAPRCPR
ncbi:DedA family protein [Acidiferrimicrobium sp. IK]|uniref:DedA family protein n=1 Tax=Acidiferrimicrobium sp. IK TaxID=2871700 RepID=UPI0021CB7113|nr:DedA family protein [Acidiferrimicrobium sp. IK]MCU4183972.1 DedA family protein [Acidiferrimicrobium sp. IK]